MKKFIQYSAVIIASFFLFTSCKKENLTAYQLQDMIYFYKVHSSAIKDSVTYSFAIKSTTLQFDTVFVPVKIMGTAKDANRVIKIGAVDSLTTAKAGIDYEFLNAVMPAGKYEYNIPIKVLRSERMKTQTLNLTIEIQKSDDFIPGIPKDPSVSFYEYGAALTYKIMINDFLSKPSNWDSRLSFYFGPFSQVRYAFVIQATGRSTFPSEGPDALPFSAYSYYKQVCINALADYEKENGPLYDENGVRITF